MKHDTEKAYADPIDTACGLFTLVIIAASIALLGLCVVSAINPLFTQEHVSIKVIEKIPYHSSRYLIVAEVNGGKEEVFSVEDEWVFLKFDASDRYASLKEGKTYTAGVCSYRIPLLTWYRNIYEIKDGSL